MSPSAPSVSLEPLARHHGESGCANPFLSTAWLEAWLRHRAPGLEPRLLAVSGGATVAPFGETRHWGLRRWCLLGHEDSDFNGLLSTRDPATAWDEVFAELGRRRDEWDILHLHSVPDAAAIVAATRRHLGREPASREYERCPAITMAPSWDEFLKVRRKLRYEIRRWSKRLEEVGPVTTRVMPPPLDEANLAILEAVERDSWKWTRGNPMFRAGSQREFLRAALGDARLPGRIWQLLVGETVAAVSLVLEGGGRWFYYLATYRDRFRNAGALLLAQIVEGAHRSGCTSVSLLRGDHGYKEAWADTSEPVHEIVVPSGLIGQGAALAYRLRWRAARSTTLQRWRARLLGVGDRRAAEAA